MMFFLDQLSRLEAGSLPKQTSYTITSSQETTVIRVTNQKKAARREKIEQKKRFFQQLEMQLVLEGHRELERGAR